MRILKIVGAVVGVLFLVAGVGILIRSDPLGPLPGSRLAGDEVAGPISDWSFTDEHMLVYVETRPESPHSVTTICFTHEGRLYIPSQEPKGKRWVEYVTADPRVRIKVGGRVYAGKAVRVTDDALFEVLLAAAQRKYEQYAAVDRESLGEVWVYRIDAPDA